MMERTSKRNFAEILRDEMFMRDRISEILRQSAKTVPEIAQELDCPSDEVILWLMGMRRYGLVEELPKSKSDDYYKYKLRQREEQC